MSIKSDRWIRRMAAKHGMIEPFEPGQVRVVDGQRIVPTACRPTATTRCAAEFKIFTNVNYDDGRPQGLPTTASSTVDGPVCIIPPNSFALARTVEYFRIPRDVLVICVGKSTYARCGIIVNVTPLEPEWEGHVTLEILQHHAAAGEDLCQRGRGPVAVLRIRRSLRDLVQGPGREVPGPARRDAAQSVALGASRRGQGMGVRG